MNLQVRRYVEKLKGQKAAKIVGNGELVELGEKVAKGNLPEMSVKSDSVFPTT